MEERQVEFALGTLSQVEARTIGEPGHRTFHLALESGQARCSVWLEKEQLFQLGLYLQEAVHSLSEEERERTSEPKEPPWAGDDPALDFKAGQVLLSRDESSNSFFVVAYEREEETESGEPSGQEGTSVSFWITVSQARALGEDSLRICAAGRPRCFLCSLPIDPEGHVCPRSNGHTVLEAG